MCGNSPLVAISRDRINDRQHEINQSERWSSEIPASAGMSHWLFLHNKKPRACFWPDGSHQMFFCCQMRSSHRALKKKRVFIDSVLVCEVFSCPCSHALKCNKSSYVSVGLNLKPGITSCFGFADNSSRARLRHRSCGSQQRTYVVGKRLVRTVVGQR